MKALAIDIGNTNIKLGIFDGETLIKTSTFPTYSDKAENYFKDLISFNIESIAISCVVSSKEEYIYHLAEKIFKVKPQIIRVAGFGTDLYCQAIYAKKNYQLPAVIFSLGTATTMICIDEKGDISGGLIIPGIECSFKGLCQSVGDLPNIEISELYDLENDSILQLNTKKAMAYGTLHSVSSSIENLAEKAVKAMNAKSFVLAGGWAETVSKFCSEKFILEPYLVLKGINERK